MLLPAIHDIVTATLLMPLMLLLPQFRGPRQGHSPARRAMEHILRH